MPRLWLGLTLVALTGPVALADSTRPAELPPADYNGQQYVDSKGCLFVRAGTPTKIVWVPRVSRKGVPDCGNPASGRRVPAAGETGIEKVPAAAPDQTSQAPATNAGGYFVAVGSYGIAQNADKAEALLTKLNYPTIRGRVQGGSGPLIIIFAGPFPDEAAAKSARTALHDSGFSDAALIRP